MELPYTVKELQTRDEMDAVVDVIWKAQFRPYMPSASIFFPVFGYSEEDRLRGIQASKDRLWSEHCQKKSDHRRWIVVTTTAVASQNSIDPPAQQPQQIIVGGALWEVYDTSPFPNGRPKLDMYWWPEGEAKDFCEEMIQQAFTPRSLWMHRKHGGLSNMVVHPDHRGRGIGSLMMEWGNRALDAWGIEGFVEASELGRALYEKHGYMVVMKLDFFVPAGKSEQWQKWAHELMPPAWYAMWRAKGGQLSTSTRNRPWQMGPSLPP